VCVYVWLLWWLLLLCCVHRTDRWIDRVDKTEETRRSKNEKKRYRCNKQECDNKVQGRAKKQE